MVTLLMIFVFRDIKLGLISMIPNVLPIMVAVLVMLVADIPLNLSNILIGSIAIGICVDDTIHFFHHFKMGTRPVVMSRLALSMRSSRPGARWH